jgi:AhpD family alkylhydroperoxidase
MQERLDPFAAAPELMKQMLGFSMAANTSGLEHSLVELVKIRASQVNGCAICIKMHTADALAAGETAERIFLLDAWHESPLYTPRERAALAWTETLTDLVAKRAPAADYAALAEHFTPEEQTKLTVVIGVINAWNRLGVGFARHEYKAPAKAAA